MKNGFYDINKLNLKDTKAFYKDAVQYSHQVNIQKIVGFKRENINEISIGEYLKHYITKSSTNRVINRLEYGFEKVKIDDREGEIVSTKVLNGSCIFLYIFLSNKKFKALIKKYKLKQIIY